MVDINLEEIHKKYNENKESLNEFEKTIYEYAKSISIGYGLNKDDKLEDKQVFADCRQDVLVWRLRLERDQYKILCDIHFKDYVFAARRLWSIKKLLGNYDKRKLEKAKSFLKKIGLKDLIEMNKQKKVDE